MKPLTREQTRALRGAIKGLAQAGVEARGKIATCRGEEKYRAWEEKRSLGTIARYHLLAYGLIRGYTREQIEKTKTILKYGECNLIYLDGAFKPNKDYYPGYYTRVFSKRIFQILTIHNLLPFRCDEKDIGTWLVNGNTQLRIMEKNKKILLKAKKIFRV